MLYKTISPCRVWRKPDHTWGLKGHEQQLLHCLQSPQTVWRQRPSGGFSLTNVKGESCVTHMHRTSDQELPFAVEQQQLYPSYGQLLISSEHHTDSPCLQATWKGNLSNIKTRTSHQLGCCARPSKSLQTLLCRKAKYYFQTAHQAWGNSAVLSSYSCTYHFQSQQKDTSTYLQNWSHLAHRRRP